MMARKNKVCGFYKLLHKPSGKFYLGSSADVLGRLAHHKWALRKDQNACRKLQEAFNTHPDLDQLDILIHPCKTREEAYDMEQSWVDRFWDHPDCLNSSRDVRSPITEQMHKPEVNDKRKQTWAKRAESEEFRQAMGKYSESRWKSPGAREAFSGANNPFAKGIKIDGTEYGSVKDAVRATGVSEKTIRKRANLESFLNYSWT